MDAPPPEPPGPPSKAPASAEAPASGEAAAASARKPEASIIFSLEELMKAHSSPKPKEDDSTVRLWDMHAATPLFGTAADEALLTAPAAPPPPSALDSMTMPSRPTSGRRLLPMLLAGAGVLAVAVAAAGFWPWGSQAEEAPEPLAVEAIEPAPAASAEPPPEPASAPEATPAEPPAAAAADDSAAAEPEPEAEPGEEAEPDEEAEPEEQEPEPVASTKAARPKPRKSRKPRSTRRKAAFNKDAARKALVSAASRASSCPGGGGKGKVQVTFSPNGRVSAARLVSSPFSRAAVTQCVLKHFRAARVPAFSGSSITVAKSFTVR